jgi:hypothetical protein
MLSYVTNKTYYKCKQIDWQSGKICEINPGWFVNFVTTYQSCSFRIHQWGIY